MKMRSRRWQEIGRKLSWQHWSIRQRLLLIAIFPIAYLFFSMVSYSYYARFKEVHEDLDSRAKTVSTALAEGLEFHLVANNTQGLRQMIYGVINSDRNIYRIEVLDSAKKENSLNPFRRRKKEAGNHKSIGHQSNFSTFR